MFADKIVDLLEPQGNWRLATDWADYAWQIRDVVEGCAGLTNPDAGRLADPGDVEVDPRGDRGGFAPRFEGRIETRFERKGLRVGRIVRDVCAVREVTN
jgi:tRNA (guanine-N7-)-methyltransferase